MIKATIQNSPYCTEICFPCSETELSDKLGALGMEGGIKNNVKNCT